MAIDQITTGVIKDNAVTAAKIPAGAVDADVGTGAITTAKLAADAVDGTKLADNAVNSEHYTDGSIDLAHLSADSVDGTKITDNAINSEHYTDGSIDTAHIGDDQVTGAKIENNPTIAGNLTVAGDIVPATPFYNRNVIINGGFDIWQRNTSHTSPASTSYTADRWAYLENGTMTHTITRSTDVPTQAQSGYKSNYSMKIDCTTADSSIANDVYCFVVQKIEGYNVMPLQGNTVTLSFWIKSTKTGTQTICWRNSNLNMNMVKEYTISTTNTWEKKEITWTFSNSGGGWNYTNGVGGWLCWNLAHGTNFHTTKDAWQSTGGVMSTSAAVNNTDSTSNDIYLAQVQLELGSSATPFEHRSYAEELLRCQRYFVAFGNGTNGAAANLHSGASSNSSQAYMNYWLPVQPRATPTWSATGQLRLSDNYVADYVATPPTVADQCVDSSQGGRIRMGGFSGLTTGRGLGSAATSGTGQMRWDMEL